MTITGTHLSGATSVKFGASGARIRFDSATRIVVKTPAHAVGRVDVTVSTAGGTSAITLRDRYYFVARPGVSGVSPSRGPTTGGTYVTITGVNLAGATTVKFGTTIGRMTFRSAKRIVVRSPAHSAGRVDVTVRTPGGTSAINWRDRFTFVARPTVSGISPSGGPTGGGTSVTITGTNLSVATTVRFGTTAGTISSKTATQIVAKSPAHAAGTVDVTVTSAGGTSATSSADQFTYVTGPGVTGISPSAGPIAGGTAVTITGTDLSGATGVMFGTTPAASISSNTPTQIVAVSPAEAANTVHITVTTIGGTSPTSSADQFRFAAPPTVTMVSPSNGPTGGGTSVTITGTNLTGATAVTFGTTPAASISSNTATQIVAVSPAVVPGTVHITVTTPGGTTATSSADQFTFKAPTITAIGTLVSDTNEPSLATESASVSPSAVGNLLTVAIETKFTTSNDFSASSVAGGGVTTWHKARSYFTSDVMHEEELWWGVVTSTGSSTLTVTYTANSTVAGGASSFDVQEFHSTSGGSTTWSVDHTGQDDTGTPSTTPSYPTLTPSTSGELYFGYLAVPGTVVAGSTPGFVYQPDVRGNQVTYNVSVSSPVTPKASSASQTYISIGMLIRAV